jgi:chromosome condensin MukBEF MukE localization factor
VRERERERERRLGMVIFLERESGKLKRNNLLPHPTRKPPHLNSN